MKAARYRVGLRVLLASVLAAPLLVASAPGASAATNSFRGVNWADARDNYVDGWVIPTGLTASDSYATVKTKADGININLWTGLAMLVFGALMVFWALARPTVPKPEKVAGEGPGQIGGSPAT